MYLIVFANTDQIQTKYRPNTNMCHFVIFNSNTNAQHILFKYKYVFESNPGVVYMLVLVYVYKICEELFGGCML